MISEAGKWVYFDICKTAGTAVGQALKSRFPDAHGKHHSATNILGGYPFCSMLRPEHLGPDYFKFAFVREPFDRIRSLHAWAMRSSEYEQCDLNTFVARLDGFADYERARYIPQVEWLRCDDGSMSLDYIGRFESLAEGWELIADLLDIPGTPLPVANATTHAPADFNDRSIEIINTTYAEDFRIFDYAPRS